MSAPSRTLHLSLWAAQVALAALFFMSGAWKTLTPLDELAQALPWVADAPGWIPRFAGISEVLGAIGLIAPSALRIAPKVTALAAAGLALVMALAVALHTYLGDWGVLPVNLAIGAACGFVIWGRTTAAPITAR